MRGYLAAVSLTVMCMLGLGAAGQADITWGPLIWSDTFEDGNYTSSPAWSAFGSPGATRAVVDWEGDKAFRLTAPYLGPPAGFSLAYVENVQVDQGMLAWVDTSALASDDVATVCVLRYSPPTLGFGTGYAVVILHSAAGPIAAQLFQINDTGYTEITDPVVVSATYVDVWVRFVALGTEADANTRLLARVWPVGQSEPETWSLDSNVPGTQAGITAYYNSGRGGIGTVALAASVTADAYFDDIEYVGGALCVDCPW